MAREITLGRAKQIIKRFGDRCWNRMEPGGSVISATLLKSRCTDKIADWREKKDPSFTPEAKAYIDDYIHEQRLALAAAGF